MTCDELWENLNFDGVTVLRFEAEMMPDDASPSDEADDRKPAMPAIFTTDSEVVVVLDTQVGSPPVGCHLVMYAVFSAHHGKPLGADVRQDKELLRDFAQRAAHRILVPRSEALAYVARGLIGPMIRLPLEYVGGAKVTTEEMSTD